MNANKTWQKWKCLEEGEELKYDAGTWVKPKDEDQLIRSLMNRKINNDVLGCLADLKEARKVLSAC